MEYSKEFYIQQFLQINDFEHVNLKTIKTIARLYKLLKRKNKNTPNKQLIKDFNDYIENIEPVEYGKNQVPHLQPPTFAPSCEDLKYRRPQQQDTQSQNSYNEA